MKCRKSYIDKIDDELLAKTAKNLAPGKWALGVKERHAIS